ncbi:MAG: ArnT family glycosyltransferase [Terriglobales bacterium]
MPVEARQLVAQIDPVTASHGPSHRGRVILKWGFLVLLVAGAFVVRVWGLSKMHFWDENVYLQNAEVICCGKNNYNEIDSRPPLLSILFAGTFLLWHSDYAAWIVVALVNALGPAFLYLGGRKMVGAIPAAIASLLLAFTPFSVGVLRDPSGEFVLDFSGHSLLSDCPALTLILLSFWLLLRALQQQTNLRFALAGFGLAMAVLMRFDSLSSVGVLLLLLLAANRPARAALACGAGFAAGLGPYLCWERFRYGGFLAIFFRGWHNFSGFRESTFYFVARSVAILSWVTLLGLGLWAGRVTLEIWREKQEGPKLISSENFPGRPSRTWEAFLCLWAVALLFFFSALSHKEPRYAIPLLPPLFLLAGIGLSTLLASRRMVPRVAGMALLAGALGFSIWPIRQRFDSDFIDDSVSEEMEVSDFLNHSVSPSTVLYTNMNYPDFAYYTNLRVVALPENSEGLHKSLKNLPSDGILIAYGQNDPDAPAEEPDPRWLNSNPHYRRLKEFPSIVLYEYHVQIPR